MSQKIPCIDMAICVKCRKCIDVCPRNAIVVIHDPTRANACKKCIKYCIQIKNVTCKPEDICIDCELCNGCGECVPVCPEKAISWVEEKS